VKYRSLSWLRLRLTRARAVANALVGFHAGLVEQRLGVAAKPDGLGMTEGVLGNVGGHPHLSRVAGLLRTRWRRCQQNQHQRTKETKQPDHGITSNFKNPRMPCVTYTPFADAIDVAEHGNARPIT